MAQDSKAVAPPLDRAAAALSDAAAASQAKVQQFSLAAVGLAFGAGVLLGALGYALASREPPTLRERLEDSAASRKLHALLDRLG